MHIAWLGKKSPFCGNVTYGREVTNALLDRGHRVSFFHFSQADREDEVPDNVPNFQEVTIPFLFKSQIYTLPKLRSSKVLLRSLKKLKPDVVHASLTLSPLDFRLPELCEELGVPLVATFHPAFDNQLRNWASGTQYLMYQLYAPALANYDRVIVFSYLQKDLLVKLGVPAERVAVIPNGVDVEKYCPGESRYQGRWRGDRVFVYQGRIAPEKNVEALLRAWKASNMGNNSKLLMVGSGPLLAPLKSQYGEEIGVKWLGFVAEEAKRIDILRSADVFILPSLVEGLSLSLLEAMSCGLACIATDAGADGEVLEEGAGVIMRTTQSVATQLQTLLPMFRDHPELTALLGQKARQRVLDRYTLSNNITRVEELYESILGAPRLPLNLGSQFLSGR
ncbi:glycosyltransferase family 4 protein [Alkalinema sp. FACHB-956]|uniref:glycosyltransferase family 4 protein n=1 Tax=Alkalinema sp. FACHB-956 TaxID=2692768 RepID=UPI0016825B20|nr:glycosyltransferase family 4 protein [Alkalinema sp. FACHB-956]MBD2328516.1 glycosyltransferase family 4 protein [Alkalinema sp. FACHB-956]